MFSVGEPLRRASELRRLYLSESEGLQAAREASGKHCNPVAARIHLNVRPGLVTVADVLEPVLATIPVEAVTVMTPDGGGTPEVWRVYQEMLRPGLTLRELDRFAFYAACREPDVAVCVATGDAALYPNVRLTSG